MKELIILAIMAMVLSGCATLEGVGKDLQTLGDKIEDAAKQ